MMKIFLALVGILSVNQVFANCDGDVTQTELNICSSKEYQAADKQLNKTYNAYIAQLDSTRKKQFKAVQSSWIKYKESDCKYQAAAYEGGSIQPLIINSCLTEKTKHRTEELENYLLEENM